MSKTDSDQKSKALLDELSSDSPQSSKIVTLIEEGADLNYQSPQNGYTSLMYAVELENYPLVECLVQIGANPLIKNHEQKIASDLIERDTSIYKYLKNNELLFATHDNDVATVKELIAQGVDINFQGAGRYSALLIAVEQSNLELVELFLTNGADLSLMRYDGQGVFELVTDSLIHIILHKGEPLSDERKKKYIAEKEEISDAKLYEQARLKTLEARKNQPFHVSQLKISRVKAPASEAQLMQLEQHFGHPIPDQLKEIFRNYNGGTPKLNKYGDYETHDSIGYFYTLNDDKDNVNNVWNIIKNLGEILGPDTLPFAEHSYNSVYYLKWEENQAKVYLLMCGTFALEHLDDEELDELDDQTPPTIIEKACDAFDDFLEGLYETH
ncbi:SMI1/KNR4 family protein [Legionella drancourtii]|uniref:Knr4/Smi1-like domain-containing protein n=1 Tax=Legionella drancourtii LLAP12 TaxID=658187 RepID=G9EMF1_9GAMM|nr:SMI1/KNR4 family protein [Legionella drancourtii]EHL31487.1 hypothetical protein LDG_6417 [Legionella drancourtii LLAP12]